MKKGNQRSLLLGAVGSAVVASICCIGPLLPLVLGIGALGAAGFFEPLRPYLLGVTAMLLAGAFYLAYRPQREEACEGGACAVGMASSRGRRILWGASVLIVMVAAFPYYSGMIWNLRTNGETSAAAASSLPGAVGGASLSMDVEGMTCAGCAAAVETALSGLAGVNRVHVDYDGKAASVKFDPSRVNPEKMIGAIETLGYKATVKP